MPLLLVSTNLLLGLSAFLVTDYLTKMKSKRISEKMITSKDEISKSFLTILSLLPIRSRQALKILNISQLEINIKNKIKQTTNLFNYLKIYRQFYRFSIEFKNFKYKESIKDKFTEFKIFSSS